MKAVAGKLRIFSPKLYLKFSFPLVAIKNFKIPITTATATATNGSAALTETEVEEINSVIPRLCSSNHPKLKEAVNLISAALSTANVPLHSLPLSILINRLAQEPDLTYTMHFLNALKYNPTTEKPLVLIPIAKMFASSFFQKGCPKKAVKLFQWITRPDFPGGVTKDSGFYTVLIDGFCKNGMILEALRVLRVMASENLVIGSEPGEVRMWVYRGLLREARVREALDVNAALDCGTLGSDGGAKVVVDLLDRMIANWVE